MYFQKWWRLTRYLFMRISRVQQAHHASGYYRFPSEYFLTICTCQMINHMVFNPMYSKSSLKWQGWIYTIPGHILKKVNGTNTAGWFQFSHKSKKKKKKYHRNKNPKSGSFKICLRGYCLIYGLYIYLCQALYFWDVREHKSKKKKLKKTTTNKQTYKQTPK